MNEKKNIMQLIKELICRWIVLLIAGNIIANTGKAASWSCPAGLDDNRRQHNEFMHKQPEKSVLYIHGNFTVYNKLYDNNTEATFQNNNLYLAGVAEGDNVVLENISVAFISPAVGIKKAVVIADATLAGTDAWKYSLSLDNSPVAYADILGLNYLGGYGRGDYSAKEQNLSLNGQIIFFWLGGAEGSENQWHTYSNWNQGMVPASTDRIIISATDHPPVISETGEHPVVINSITEISNDASIILETGASLLIGTDASVNTADNAFIVLNHDAFYINSGQNTPRLIVKHQIQGGAGWRNVSAPVKISYADLFNGLVTQGFNGSDFPDLQPNLLWWHEASHGTTLQHWRMPENISDTIPLGRGHFHFVFDGARMLNPDGTLSNDYYHDSLPVTINASGSEYVFEAQNDFDFGATFTTAENHANGNNKDSTYIETNVSDIGWNLIGNPTASFLDWDNEHGWTKNNIDNVIYVWDPDVNNGEYLTWNGVTGSLGNGLISPFKAFWVKANNTNPMLSFNNSAKTLGNELALKNESIVSCGNRIVLPITLSNQNMITSSYIMLSETGVVGHDNMDAFRLEPLTNTWLALYTNSSPEHLCPLAINNLPIDSHNELLIPLFVDAVINGHSKCGEFQLEWDIPEYWPDHLFIHLMDHRQEKAISMRSHNHYSFYMNNTTKSYPASISPLELPNRIVAMILNEHSATSVDSPKTQEKYDNPFSIVISNEKFWKDPGYIPDKPIMLPIYPNPFVDKINIPFRLIRNTQLQIGVFDTYGRLTEIVAKGTYPPGLTEVTWNAANRPPGVYHVRLISSEHFLVQNIIKIEN